MPNFAPRLYQYIGGVCRRTGHSLIAAGGRPDHVHLVVSLGKESSVADAVRDIKSNSSRWIHDTLPNLGGFAWQSGYEAFAVSYSNVNEVRQYIANQQEHHRARTFKEELTALLKRHKIEYDERYIWD